jgi:gamma-glutamylcyclotransferase (GGCT)/AIG2-like uncharacterized protein YtfP
VLKVFVYGTLKPGEQNYLSYCGDRVITAVPALVTGKLFALPAGYPALVWAESAGWVQGFLLTFATNEPLQLLDQLEDYQENRPAAENAYQRRQVTVFSPDIEKSPIALAQAWVYLMEQKQIAHLGGIFLPQGYWTSDLSKE